MTVGLGDFIPAIAFRAVGIWGGIRSNSWYGPGELAGKLEEMSPAENKY